MPTADSESTITAGKNLLASLIIYGQLKSNELLKENNSPNNAKPWTRELIAATARILRPECTPESVRDILHYRSRKVRCLFKEYKNGKLHGETSLGDRLIEAEKALLNSLEVEANIPTDFMQRPDLNDNCIEILNRMHEFISDPVFRNQLLQSLPALPAMENGRSGDGTTSVKDEEEIKNDQESDGDSVHASSSSFEDQIAPPIESTFMSSDRHDLRMNGVVESSSDPTPNEPPTKSTLRASAAKKRRLEDGQMEVIEMKKDLLRMQRKAFEKQVQMCEEVVKTLNEMRSWMDLLQRRTNSLIPSAPVHTQQLSGYLPASLMSNPLPNLSAFSSFLANAADSGQPLL